MAHISPLTQQLPGAISSNRASDLNALPASTSKQAQASAEAFEAVFIETMVGMMFEGVQTDGPLGGGSSEKIYRSLMIRETSKHIAKGGGLGLKQDIYNDMISLQEGANR